MALRDTVVCDSDNCGVFGAENTLFKSTFLKPQPETTTKTF